MGTYPPPGQGGVGRRIEEAIELIEMELRHAAAYVNDNVIPQVRTESISALRTAADAMRKFADHLDQQTQQAARPAPPPPQPPAPEPPASQPPAPEPPIEDPRP
jgi:predicted transcriptional regulator